MRRGDGGGPARGPTPARLLAAWGPFLAWGALLLFLGSRAPGALPGGELLAFPGADKAAHFGAYAVLGALAQGAAERRTLRGALLAGGIGAIAVGGLDEVLQAATPGRTADPWDLAADLLGGLAGAWAFRRTFPPGARS